MAYFKRMSMSYLAKQKNNFVQNKSRLAVAWAVIGSFYKILLQWDVMGGIVGPR